MQGSPYLYKGFVGGDFILYADAQIVVMDTVLLPTNNGSTALVYYSGHPFSYTPSTTNTPTTATATIGGSTEAAAKGLLAEKTTVLPGQSAVPGALLVRGPSAIDFNALPTKDVAGNLFVAATLKTAIAAMGIEIRYEGVTQQVQTT
jgi:hypothetical protein